jgi:putative nucleotidyltransferase with HDIG domain
MRSLPVGSGADVRRRQVPFEHASSGEHACARAGNRGTVEIEAPVPSPWRGLSRSRALLLAVLLGALALAFRIGDSRVGDGEGFLFVLPVAVLALGFGLRGGLAGAALGMAATVAWDLTAHGGPAITPLGYANRALALFAVGALLGRFVDHAERMQAENVAVRGAAESASSLGAQVRARTAALERERDETLKLLSTATEYRDDGTFHHTERVGALSAEIAHKLGVAADRVVLVQEAALLHDVGKLAIPDEILLKPGNLDEREQQIMMRHTTLGAKLLADSTSPVLRMAATIAATHHEWWDGTGYPLGLAGEHIPLIGRIVAVADVFDALTHDRPYKSAWPVRQAIARIKRGAGTQFDPRVVEAFLATQPEATAPPDLEPQTELRVLRGDW